MIHRFVRVWLHRPALWAVLTVIFTLMLTHALPATSLAQEPPSSPEYDPAAVTLPEQSPAASLGQAIYLESCAPCHGETGDSDGPTTASLPAAPPPFSDPETIWQRSPARYFHTTKFGRLQNLMPPWQNQLSDAQIWRAVYYAWSLHTDQETVAAGAELYEAAAEAADDATLASLAETYAPETLTFLTQAELAEAVQAAFPAASADWTAAELRGVLDYVRTFAYIPPWESAFRAGAGVIEGAVLLRSAGAETDGGAEQPLAEQPVTLTAYQEFEPITTFETQTDAAGRFRFDELSTDTGIVYIVETPYRAINYTSDVLDLSRSADADGAPTLDVIVPVYEPSDDAAGVFISRANWVVEMEPGALIVGLILSIGNDATTAFAGRNVDGIDVPVTVKVPIPVGATDVQFQDGVLGGRYHRADGSVYDTLAVTPGAATARIFMSYRLPVDGTTSRLEQAFVYPINQMNLLIPNIPDVEVDAPALAFMGEDTVQGFTYRIWGAENLSPQTIAVDLSGLLPPGATDPRAAENSADNENAAASSAATTPGLRPTVPIALGSVLVVVLIGLVAWPLRKQRPTDPAAALARERRQLVERIAQLDDRRALGQISDEMWSCERARLKNRLLTVAGQFDAPGPPPATRPATNQPAAERTP